jgi:hypothetical protein
MQAPWQVATAKKFGSYQAQSQDIFFLSRGTYRMGLRLPPGTREEHVD